MTKLQEARGAFESLYEKVRRKGGLIPRRELHKIKTYLSDPYAEVVEVLGDEVNRVADNRSIKQGVRDFVAAVIDTSISRIRSLADKPDEQDPPDDERFPDIDKYIKSQDDMTPKEDWIYGVDLTREATLRPGLERAVEIVDGIKCAESYSTESRGFRWAKNRILDALRSELEPEKEIGWEDVPVRDTFRARHNTGSEHSFFKYHDEGAVRIGYPHQDHKTYPGLLFDGRAWTIISIDNQTEGGDE